MAGRLPGISLSSARVLDDAEVRVAAVVEAQGSTITVSGEIAAPWVGDCRRCLAPTGGEASVTFTEVFEPEPVEGETYPLGGDDLDLEPVVRELLALALPLAPLCSEDCAGPDPQDYPIDAGRGAEDLPPPGDPRWAALDELRFDG